MMFLIVIIAIVIIIIVVTLLIRKRKSKSGDINLQNSNDMESFLSDFSPNTNAAAATTSANNLENDHLQEELREHKISEKQKGKELKK
jgi:FtsZ-interacting cell division protein ZipA